MENRSKILPKINRKQEAANGGRTDDYSICKWTQVEEGLAFLCRRHLGW